MAYENGNASSIRGTKVSKTDPANGETLAYNSTSGEYEPAAAGGGASDIDGLTDGINDGSSVFLGTGAGIADDGTTNNNTGLGTDALGEVTTGISNTAVGKEACGSNSASNNCTAIGYLSLRDATGSQNTAIGSNSGLQITSGAENTALGYIALQQNQLGSNNVAIGGRAMRFQSAGSNNIVIGQGVDAPNLTGSDQINIGDTIYGNRVSGNVGIGGVNSSTSTLNVTGLPTSSAGLVTGDVWNNSGVLTIV